MTGALATLAVLGGILLLIVLWFIGAYNGLVRLRNAVKEAWAQIDVQLKRRHDLIPNLVETVKGYAKHEAGTLEAVIKARAAAVSSEGKGPAAQGPAEGELSQALGRLMMIAEQYPDLKANTNFLALQEELTSTENKIGFARQHYNERVMTYNNQVESIPSNLVAGVFNFAKEPFFELTEKAEREAPKVSF